MPKCLLFNVSSGTNHVGNGRSVGVYRIAHYLRQSGWDAEVIDFVSAWSLEELCEVTQSRVTNDTKFISFSHMFSVWSDTLESFAGWLKQNYPEIPLLSGSGVSPQFVSNHIDYYIQGFGEHALLVLLSWLFSNGPRPKFNLIKANGKNLLSANEHYPAFPMKSLNVIYEDRDFIQPYEWLGIEFARGCKFQCDFCNFPVLGVKGDYSRDAEDFRIQVQDAYDRFGVTNYLVADETFNDRTEKISKFADMVEQLNFSPWFTGFIRPDLIVSRAQDKEHLLRMGFLGHHYGVESFNHQASKSVGKGMHPDKLKQGILEVKNYFETHGSRRYRTLLTFILGLPGETVDDLNDTTKWLVENWRGQAWTPFVLDIPIGDLNRLSKMSLDYKKYGYRPFTGPIKDITVQQNRVAKELLIWENDQMNYYEAYSVFEKMIDIRNELDNGFTLAPWDLAMVGLPGDISERLSLNNSYVNNQEVDNIRQKFVENYIKKKLNV